MSYDVSLNLENVQEVFNDTPCVSTVLDKYVVIHDNLDRLPVQLPDTIVVNFDLATDEFYLEDHTMCCSATIEVVEHNTAIENDLSFLEGEDYITERTEYKLTEKHSMYTYLGTSKETGIRYYFRTL
jgi:hypothetical protein